MQSKNQPQGRTNWQDFCLFVLVTVVNFGQMNFTAIKHYTAAAPAAFNISCSSLSSWTLLIRTEGMSQRMYILGHDSYLSLSLCCFVNDIFSFFFVLRWYCYTAQAVLKPQPSVWSVVLTSRERR